MARSSSRRPATWALALWAAATSCRGGSTLGLQLGGGGNSNSNSNSNSPPPIDANQTPRARAATFDQGLFRGQDPRLVQRDGFYFFTGYLGANLTLYKSKSMVDLGVGKKVPGALGDSLGSPIFIDAVAGRPVGAWFVFGSTRLFVNTLDPYDHVEAWRVAADMPWTDVGAGFTSVPFDFEVFQNPQDGPFKGRWYLLWARASTDQGYVEHVYGSEIAALSTASISLSQTAGSAANRLLTARGPGDWTDVVVEAPGVAINGPSVTIAYSGNGAASGLYAVGLATLRQGADPSLAGSWIDLSHGECDGYPGGSQPAFARTTEVPGPGVSRFVKSADGSEDWMVYNAKMFDTSTLARPAPNESYARYIGLQKISWQAITCAGQGYTVPLLGQPLPPGHTINLPAGDPGPTAKASPFRIEAESMVAFGNALGPSVQNLPTANTAVLAVACASCSSGFKHGNLAELARDQDTTPRQSGLIYRNCPPASGLTVAHANPAASSLDLYLGGRRAGALALPATGDENTYMVTTAAATIAAGDELRLVYEDGKSTQVNLDYIELNR